MSRTRSTGALALLALGLMLGVARSQTADTPYVPRAMASNGAVVLMQDIAGLDCAGMTQVLRRIDLSRYRGAEPVPVGHPDWLIFEYEDQLAQQYYYSCTMVENQLEDPGPAFSLGFGSQ